MKERSDVDCCSRCREFVRTEREMRDGFNEGNVEAAGRKWQLFTSQVAYVTVMGT